MRVSRARAARPNSVSLPRRKEMYDKIELGEYATGAPALSTIDTVPAIAWTGIDQPGHLNVLYGYDLARPNKAKVTLWKETSRVGAALATNGDLSFLGWTGTDSPSHLNVASPPDAW